MTKQLSQTASEQTDNSTAQQQYRQFIREASSLSPEQEQALIERAREGDSQARTTLIESCLDYIHYWAGRYYYACRYHSWRIEHEVLIQEGSFSLIKGFDAAMCKERPLAYLKGIAKLEMKRYCFYHQSLISLPDHGKWEPVPEVDSLDVPVVGTEDLLFYRDILEAPVPLPEPPAQTYTALYQSLGVLTPDQREVVERSYGLGENCCDALVDIHKRERNDGTRMTATAAYAMHEKALKKMHTALQSPQNMHASYSMRQACEVLDVTPQTLGTFVSQRHIRKFGRGIYSKDDVEKLAQTRCFVSA